MSDDDRERDEGTAIDAAVQQRELQQDAEADAAEAGDDLQAEFDAMMAEAVEADLPVPAIPWDYPVMERKGAAFVIGAIKMVERQIEDRRAQYEIELDTLRRLAAFWRTHYLPAVRAVVEAELVVAGGKSITLNTGCGPKPTRAGFKKSVPRLEVTDEQAALEWARENVSGSVRKTTTFRLLKDPVKQHIVTTGDQPDGCVYHPGGEDVFYVQGMKLEEQDDV